MAASPLETDSFRRPWKERRRKVGLLSSQTGSCHSGHRPKNKGGPKRQRALGGGWSPLSPTLEYDSLFEPLSSSD